MTYSEPSPSKNKINLYIGLISLGISAILSSAVYYFLLQTSRLAKRELALALLLWIALIPLVYLLLSRFLLPRLNTYPRRFRCNFLLASLAVGLLSALVVRPPLPLYLFYPSHALTITIPPGDKDREISLLWISTSLRDISFDELSQQGNWSRSADALTFSGPNQASLSWFGRTGGSARLVFLDSPALRDLKLGWDESSSPLDISRVSNGEIPLTFTFSTGWQSNFAARLIIGLIVGFLFLIIFLFLDTLQVKPAPRKVRKKGSWLFYSLPMIAVWGVYLLTFWPGMMSLDSNVQWNQLITGVFNDAHPVFHTLYLWLLTRLWFSPASVALFQILALSFSIAWGISVLDDQGLPAWAAWFLSALFALSPVNGNMVIILWKDIPYAISLFLLSLIILRIVFSHGEWLDRWTHWLSLALVCLCVSSFRHNGIPVPLLTLPVLIFFYRPFWKPLTASLSLFLCLYLLIHGPLYSLLKVQANPGFSQQILVFHIAAHMVNGAPLTEKETDLARDINPSSYWRYDCCSVNDTEYRSGISEERNGIVKNSIQKLFVDLFIKEPDIEFQHMVCTSSLVWEIPNRCGAVTVLPFSSSLWIAPELKQNIEHSLFPGLLPKLSKLILSLHYSSSLDLLITPAIYLGILFFSTSFIAYRKKDPYLLIFLIPAVVQSIVMIMINVSSEYRYQYGVMVTGLFGLGLLLLGLTFSNKEEIASR